MTARVSMRTATCMLILEIRPSGQRAVNDDIRSGGKRRGR